MPAYFTTKQASELIGASKQAIRVYTTRPEYARYMSTDATPATGLERRFSADDLKLMAFIYHYTSMGEKYDTVTERLAAGELEHFDWQPPDPDLEPEPQSAADTSSSALVPLERLQAAQLLLQDAQRREAAAADQVAGLQAEVRELERQLGEARGELAGVKESRYKAPAWWRAVFGGRSAE